MAPNMHLNSISLEIILIGLSGGSAARLLATTCRKMASSLI